MTAMRTATAFLLVAIGLPAAAADVDWSLARPVTVKLIDERFVPDALVFEHGVPYRWTFTSSRPRPGATGSPAPTTTGTA